ncbi:MAG: nuclear transport factor 2 family protein [Chloroflexota bacterium]
MLGGPGPLGPPRSAAERAERFRAWLVTFTSALEAADLDGVARCFAVECSWQPAPFDPPLRGKAAIREHAAGRFGARAGLAIRAEILGVGATYNVVHWALTWGSGEPGEHADGILLVALDAMGRASAIREWNVEEEAPAAAGG